MTSTTSLLDSVTRRRNTRPTDPARSASGRRGPLKRGYAAGVATTTYSRSVDIDAPIETLSRFHLDTRSAPLISPDGAKFIDISEDSPVDLVRQLTLHIKGPRTPLAHAWRVRIAALEPDRLVVDATERAPFAFWRCAHHIARLPGGLTRMTDCVTHAWPLGVIVRLADPVRDRRQLKAIFDVLRRRTRTLFEARARPAR